MAKQASYIDRLNILSSDIETIKKLIKESLSEEINNNENSYYEKVINPSYLTRKETALRLKISLTTLNEYSKQGIIQSYRVGKRVLYKPDEVEESVIQVKNLKYILTL